MADEREDQAGNSVKPLSYRGKRDLIIGASLMVLPILLLILFKINVGSTLAVLGLVFGTFLIIRTWSRELNSGILKRRYFDE